MLTDADLRTVLPNPLKDYIREQVYEAIKAYRNVPPGGNMTGVGILSAEETWLYDRIVDALGARR